MRLLREALERYSPLRLIKTVSPAGETGEFVVETGESRTYRSNRLILLLLDQLEQIGETARQLKQEIIERDST